MRKIFCLIFPLFLFSCKCSSLLGSTLDIDIQQNDANSVNLFFCSAGKNLYGFDKVTYEQKLKIVFNIFIAYGDKTPDGRILLADQGTNAGSWGSRLLVLDKNYSLVKEISTNPTPTEPLVFGNHIFVGSASMIASSKYGLQVFNVDTYSKEKDFEADCIIERPNYAFNGSNLFLSVGDYRAQENINPYILSVNLSDLSVDTLHGYSPNYSNARILSTIFDSVLIITTPSISDSFHINTINIRTNTVLSAVRLDTVPGLFTGMSEPFLLPPRLIANKLYYLAWENVYPSKAAKLLCFSFPQLQLQSATALNYDYRLVAFDYYYLNDSAMAIYSADNGLNIISFPSGSLLKHAAL